MGGAAGLLPHSVCKNRSRVCSEPNRGRRRDPVSSTVSDDNRRVLRRPTNGSNSGLRARPRVSATVKKSGAGWSQGGRLSAPVIDGVGFSEGDLLLQALNGFILVITAEGYVFYSSPTIQDYLGFHQSDVIHQSVFELIHTDDRSMFKRQLHFALDPSQGDEAVAQEGAQNGSEVTSVVAYDPQRIPPENSSFLERSFCCRFRCLLDNSSGFLALNFHGRLKYLHGQSKMAEDGTVAHPQLALFVIAAPVQPPSVMEIRTKTLIFQTKHKLDFTPLGIDTRGKVVLGYNEIELCMRGSGYQFIHAADMMHCADNHIRMIKTGESGLTVFRLLTKTEGWVWVQANARLVFKGGRPDFIIARQRALTNEEGEEHLRQRRMQLPFNLTTGEAVLYETGPTLDMPDINGRAKMQKMSDGQAIDPDSLLGLMLKQDQSAYLKQSESQFSLDQVFMDSRALLNVPSDAWQQGTLDSSVNEETPVKAMLDTLEQILEDQDTLKDLDIDEAELEEWENALLSMNTSSSSRSVELDDILTEDIFSFVANTMLKDNGTSQGLISSKQLSSLGALNSDFCSQVASAGAPECLSVLDLQDTAQPNNQVIIQQNSALFGGLQNEITPDPQTGFMGIGGEATVGRRNAPVSVEEIMLFGPQAPIDLNDPTLQTQPDGMFTQFWDTLKLSHPNDSNSLMAFDPALAGSSAQMQSQIMPGASGLQSVFSPAKQNHLPACPQQSKQPASCGPVSLSVQNSLLPTMAAQPMAFQQYGAFNTPSNVAPSQDSQWFPSIPNTNFTDTLRETSVPSLALQQQPDLSSSPTTGYQGHLSVQAQNSRTARLQTWEQQKHASPVVYNGLPVSCRQARDYQGTPLAPANPQSYSGTYGPLNMTSGVCLPQEDKVDVPQPVTSSCMFENGSSSPINGMRLGHSGLFSCQKASLPNGPNPPLASCEFQSKIIVPGVNPAAVAPEEVGMASLSCRMVPGFSPEGLRGQQQYVGCNGQTQVTMVSLHCSQWFYVQGPIATHLTDENAQFALLPLSNGTQIFSQSSQTNCCDY
ncbi:aryl hydrocarbon receptor 2-like [Scleropages formosus]|uniref:Aryl hydrocarbon receptor 2-like n=1 Tax=Scleropages formosus TaxID=113540 RepID=A0A0P7WH66_SCLFO|nr:aryl hydrocarbon receptor 2-like [Scleropages formosus]